MEEIRFTRNTQNIRVLVGKFWREILRGRSHRSRQADNSSQVTSAMDIPFPGALSICMEKPVVLVGQQMEQSFPLGIFRKKWNSFRRGPLFPFLPK